MKTLDHKTVGEWLELDLDGEFPEARRAAYEAHLASCQACDQRRREMAQLVTLLRESRVAARPGFAEEVVRALPAAAWEARSGRSWSVALGLLLGFGGGAAVLLGWSAANMHPVGPWAGALRGILDLFRSSILAGAGLLNASWRGVGMAMSDAFSASWGAGFALGALVLAVNGLLFRLVRRARVSVRSR